MPHQAQGKLRCLYVVIARDCLLKTLMLSPKGQASHGHV